MLCGQAFDQRDEVVGGVVGLHQPAHRKRWCQILFESFAGCAVWIVAEDDRILVENSIRNWIGDLKMRHHGVAAHDEQAVCGVGAQFRPGAAHRENDRPAIRTRNCGKTKSRAIVRVIHGQDKRAGRLGVVVQCEAHAGVAVSSELLLELFTHRNDEHQDCFGGSAGLSPNSIVKPWSFTIFKFLSSSRMRSVIVGFLADEEDFAGFFAASQFFKNAPEIVDSTSVSNLCLLSAPIITKAAWAGMKNTHKNRFGFTPISGVTNNANVKSVRGRMSPMLIRLWA